MKYWKGIVGMVSQEIDSKPGITHALYKFYLPGFANAKKHYDQDNKLTGTVDFAKQVNNLPILQYQVHCTSKLFKDLKNDISKLDKSSLHEIPKSIYNPLYGASKHGFKLDEFGFFKYTMLQNRMKNSGFGRALLKLDKNLLDLKWVQRLFSKIFKDTYIKSAPHKGISRKFITGVHGAKAGKGAFLTANTLGRIPVLSIALSSILELPNISKAFKNGDGANQMGRSALNIAGYTIGSALLGSAMIGVLPPLGGFIGGALGVWIGGSITKKIGEFLFGKPKPDSKNNPFSQNHQNSNQKYTQVQNFYPLYNK